MSKTVWILLTIILLVPAAVLSATWRVEQDGSGDYTVIMHAVYAASAGDTILIGPGEYRNFVQLQPVGWDNYLRTFVYVAQANLTIMGTSVSEVIIGDPIYDPDLYNPVGVFVENSAVGFRIQNVTVENCVQGLRSELGLAIEDCVFRGGNIGVGLLAAETVTIEGCEFWDHSGRGILSFDPCPDSIVRGCQFYNASVSVQDAENFQLIDCEFNGDTTGVQYYLSTGAISQCKFFDQYNYGVVITESSNVSIRDCEVRNDSVAMIVQNRSTVHAEGNIFEGHAKAIYFWGPLITAEFSGNHILRSGGLFVETYWFPGTEGDVILDFENNYWGVTSASAIEEGIWDMNDDPEIHAIVDFEPFSSEPLPAEPAAWGDLKSMFR